MAPSTIATDEKRKHRRYQVEPGSFGIFCHNSSFMPGLIVDLSEGGLGFFHHEGEEWAQLQDERFIIFGDTISVNDLQMEPTSDNEFTDKEHPVYKLLASRDNGKNKIRRCGMQFLELTKKQQRDIEILITEFNHHYSEKTD